jgi:hypothetical protein
MWSDHFQRTDFFYCRRKKELATAITPCKQPGYWQEIAVLGMEKQLFAI